MFEGVGSVGSISSLRTRLHCEMWCKPAGAYKVLIFSEASVNIHSSTVKDEQRALLHLNKSS